MNHEVKQLKAMKDICGAHASITIISAEGNFCCRTVEDLKKAGCPVGDAVDPLPYDPIPIYNSRPWTEDAYYLGKIEPEADPEKEQRENNLDLETYILCRKIEPFQCIDGAIQPLSPHTITKALQEIAIEKCQKKRKELWYSQPLEGAI